MAINLGFVGLGIMGRPMALNLMKGGHALAVYARRAESMAPLVQAGATACRSPAEVAAKSDVTFVMVSDSPDVEAVVLGPGGCIEGAKPGAVVVDMSTISSCRDAPDRRRGSPRRASKCSTRRFRAGSRER